MNKKNQLNGRVFLPDGVFTFSGYFSNFYCFYTFIDLEIKKKILVTN